MIRKKELYKNCEISERKFFESLEGWQAYARWANTFNLRKRLLEDLSK